MRRGEGPRVSLFDVVPWTVGFAHSWALRWMLEQPELGPRILEAIDGLPGQRPWRLVGEVGLEPRLKPHRADLAFSVASSDGRSCDVALETKVNDPYRAEQLDAYAASHHPVAYMPGLTGVLVAPMAGEARSATLFGSRLVAAVGELVPDEPLIGGYVDGVRAHANAIAEATDAAVTGADWRPPDAVPYPDAAAGYRSAAWIAEVCRAIGASQFGYRATAYDYGYFWNASYTQIDGRDAFVELSLDHSTARAQIRIKVGAGTGSLRDVFDHLGRRPPAGAGSVWERCRWGKGGTRSVWKAAADGRSVQEGIEIARAAAEHVRRHAG